MFLLFGSEMETYSRMAINSALKRATKSGLTFAAKAIKKYYYITEANVKKYTWIRTKYNKSEYSTEIDYLGYHIPLIAFDSSVDKQGRVSARVKRASGGSRGILDNVFKQTVGGYRHTSYFERATDDRLPIKEKLGPSAPQMMFANEALSDAIVEKIQEEYNKRLDHEIDAILNGWRMQKGTQKTPWGTTVSAPKWAASKLSDDELWAGK